MNSKDGLRYSLITYPEVFAKQKWKLVLAIQIIISIYLRNSIKFTGFKQSNFPKTVKGKRFYKSKVTLMLTLWSKNA